MAAMKSLANSFLASFRVDFGCQCLLAKGTHPMSPNNQAVQIHNEGADALRYVYLRLSSTLDCLALIILACNDKHGRKSVMVCSRQIFDSLEIELDIALTSADLFHSYVCKNSANFLQMHIALHAFSYV